MTLFRLLLSFFLALPALLRAADPAGHWEGQIAIATTKLDIRVDLDHPDGKGPWAGTIDIPVQALRNFKLQPVTVDGAAVTFAMTGIPGTPSFAGQLDQDANTIAGEFTQGAIKATFKLERRTRPAPGPTDVPARGIPGEGLAGHWRGALKTSVAIELRLALEIAKSAEGPYSGTFFSVDQTRTGLPMAETAESTGSVIFKVPSVGGSYEGKLSNDGAELSGEWQQGAVKLPLTFRRVAEALNLNRPQDPKPPFPYSEARITINHEAAGIKLAGTFTQPLTAGPHPAVVLITGSGPQDRDEALMGHRPFLVLADHLARAGIAVLRCDDRGVGQSTGDFSSAVTDDFVTDALAAAGWLRACPGIDSRRIGLIGHSEGGVVAPQAAVQKPDEIAFIVMLAGPGVPMEDLLLRQGRDMGRVMGMSEDRLARSAETQRALFTMLKETPDNESAATRALEIVTRQFNETTPEERKAMGYSESFLAGQVQMVTTPWFRKLLAYDPRPALRKVTCPVLALNGDKDVQVASAENLAGIKDALAAGGNTRVKTVEFPSLNHLFQTCATGAISEYGQIEETFAPAVLSTISKWILEQPRNEGATK